MKLSICSYNCCSLSKNIDIVRQLAGETCDVIFLQETLVTEERLGDLNYIDENYNVVGSASVYSDKAVESNSGRSEGGLACLWRKNSQFIVDKIVTTKDYIVLSLKVGSLTLALVNVYLRSDIWEIRTLNAYLEALSELEDILVSTKFDSVYFIGDFNADPYVGRAWGNLTSFMERNNLVCHDKEILQNDSFTFISYGNGYTKWLDHVVGRNSTNFKVSNAHILYDMIGSDHLPLMTTITILDTSIKECSTPSEPDVNYVFTNWEKLSMSDIREIDDLVVHELSTVGSCEAMTCLGVGCRNRDHLRQLSSFYIKLCHAIIRGRENFIKDLTIKSKYKVIPGWNRRVKHHYSHYRENYLRWLSGGRQRIGALYDLMKESRKIFKKALNDCKLNENRESNLSIQEKYINKNMKSFWQGVQQKNNKVKYSEIIDGKNKAHDIIDIFTEKFLNVDNEGDCGNEVDFIDELKQVWLRERKFYPKVSLERMKELIKRLNVGEGHDSIHTIFLKSMSDILLQLLVNFMNACFSHCYVPVDLLNGDINPTIKDNNGNTTDSSNFRKVMQSSLLLKLFEIHILDILIEKVYFNSMQFGYEKYTSTTDACLVFKETVNKYIRNKKDKAFCLFVDLTKAFDTVNHLLLGKILLKRKLPPDLVLFIMHYLRNQRARIVWKGEKGEYVQVERGVRQGGILSPFLFKLYIDDVLNDICNSDVGCKLGIKRINVLAYADDLALMANSRDHLDILYRILQKGMTDLQLTINKNKTKCIIFGQKSHRPVVNDISNIRLHDDNFEIVSEYKYLGHIIMDNLSDVSDVAFRLN